MRVVAWIRVLKLSRDFSEVEASVMLIGVRNQRPHFEQLERDKCEAEEKLRELQLGEQDIDRVDRIKSLEKELALAKEVRMR